MYQKVTECFENAWNDLLSDYSRKYYPYIMEWDVIVDLVPLIKKQLSDNRLKKLDVHVDLSLSPKQWKKCELFKQKSPELKKKLGMKGYPRVDIALFNLDPNKKFSEYNIEQKEGTFCLVAEVKFSAFPENGKNIKNLDSRLKLEPDGEFYKTLKLLHAMTDLKMCKTSYFCYFDEFHDNARLVKKRLKELKSKCGKSVKVKILYCQANPEEPKVKCNCPI